MHLLINYYNTIIKHDLIYKFHYKDLKNIPKLKKIILNFNCKTSNFKILASSLLALQIISTKKGRLARSKYSNIVLKIRKGNPVGCYLILTNKSMYKFLDIYFTRVFPKIKEKFLTKKLRSFNTLTYSIKNLFLFKKLEKNYLIFNELKSLQISFVTSAKTNKELCFLLNSFKFHTKTLQT